MAPRSLPPAKKRKTNCNSGPAEQIKFLENALIEAAHGNESLNALPDLLDILVAMTDVELVSKAIYALYRIFVVLINGGKFGLGGDEASKLVKTWLLEQLNVYVDFLCGLLKDEEGTLRVSCRIVTLNFPLKASRLLLFRFCSLSKNTSLHPLLDLNFHFTFPISVKSLQRFSYARHALGQALKHPSINYSILMLPACFTKNGLAYMMTYAGFSCANLCKDAYRSLKRILIHYQDAAEYSPKTSDTPS